MAQDRGKSAPARPPPVTHSWTRTVIAGVPMPIRLVPVLDLKAGLAVHAVGGDRAHYRLVRSVLHEAGSVRLGRPIAIALWRTLYRADLDAIAGAGAMSPLMRSSRG